MTEYRIARRAILTAGVVAAAPLRSARAAYPDRPLRWIVAYAAGGGTDTLARILGAAMSPGLGQPVVVENRPGGATSVGAEAAARAAPDGYTLLSADNGTLVFNTALFRRLSYDPARDFRPLGLTARFPLLVVLRRTSSFRSAAEFVEAARRRPGEIDYASPGIGSPHHLAMERLAKEIGLRFNHVPYRGMAPALNDLLAGTVEAAVVDLPSALEHVRARTIRPVAICSPTRFEGLPSVPTAAEALGLPGFEAFAWQGLVTQARVPDDAARRVSAELATALRREAVLSRMRDLGLEPLPGGPEEFQALIESERAIWVPLIRERGIVLE